MDSKNHADISFLVCFVPYVYRQPFIFSTYCKIAHVHDDFHLFLFYNALYKWTRICNNEKYFEPLLYVWLYTLRFLMLYDRSMFYVTYVAYDTNRTRNCNKMLLNFPIFSFLSILSASRGLILLLLYIKIPGRVRYELSSFVSCGDLLKSIVSNISDFFILEPQNRGKISIVWTDIRPATLNVRVFDIITFKTWWFLFKIIIFFKSSHEKRRGSKATARLPAMAAVAKQNCWLQRLGLSGLSVVCDISPCHSSQQCIDS